MYCCSLSVWIVNLNLRSLVFRSLLSLQIFLLVLVGFLLDYLSSLVAPLLAHSFDIVFFFLKVEIDVCVNRIL